MFHKLIFIVNTLFNILLFSNESAYLRPSIHLFYSNTFSPFFLLFFFFGGGSLTDFFVIKMSPIFFFNLLDSMSSIKEKMKGVT